MMTENTPPSPSTPVNVAARNRSRATLIGLVLLFMFPLLAAWVLYLNPDWSQGRPTTNYGEFLTPARPLPPLLLRQQDGSEYDLAGRKDRWSLLQLVSADCDQVCRETLHKARQVRLTLGRDMHRVQRVLVVSGESGPSAELLAEYPELLVLQATPEQAVTLAELTLPDDGVSVPLSGRLYIIDPLGNLMMSYPSDFEMKGLQKDIKRLLKASYVG